MFGIVKFQVRRNLEQAKTLLEALIKVITHCIHVLA